MTQIKGNGNIHFAPRGAAVAVVVTPARRASGAIVKNLRMMQAPRIVVFVHDCPHGDAGAAEVAVRKGWWGGPGKGGEGRELHRFCIPLDEGTEGERTARALEAAAAAMRG